MGVSVGKDRFDRVMKSSKSVYADNQDVLDTTFFDVRKDAHPEFGAIVVSKQKA